MSCNLYRLMFCCSSSKARFCTRVLIKILMIHGVNVYYTLYHGFILQGEGNGDIAGDLMIQTNMELDLDDLLGQLCVLQFR